MKNGSIVKFVGAAYAMVKLDIHLYDGLYNLENFNNIVSTNPDLHKEICLPCISKRLSPEDLNCLSANGEILVEEITQILFNVKTSTIQAYLDVKNFRHLHSKIGLLVMVVGAFSL